MGTKGHRKIAQNEMMKNIANRNEFDVVDNPFSNLIGGIFHKIDKALRIMSSQDNIDLNEMERRFKK